MDRVRLFHIVTTADWQAAQAVGEYAPPSLASEGFVHFSWASQVARTADAHYRDVPDLIVLEVDPSLLDAPVVVEDSYGSGQEFPHVYGAIPVSAVVAEHPLETFR